MAKAFSQIKNYPETFDRYENTKLVSRQDAELVIEACAKENFLNPKEAASYAAELMGFFLTREAIDPAQFTLGVSQLFQNYHKGFVKRVVDPVNGLPSREKWLPAIAVIKEALEAEKNTRLNVLAKAQLTIREIDRRKAVWAENARIENSKGDEEHRRQVVQNLLRARPMPNDSAA